MTVNRMWNSDDSSISNIRMREEDELQFRRRDLISIAFNHFLEPVRNDEESLVVQITRIPCPVKSFLVKSFCIRLLVVEVVEHELRSFDTDFPYFVLWKRLAITLRA